MAESPDDEGPDLTADLVDGLDRCRHLLRQFREVMGVPAKDGPALLQGGPAGPSGPEQD